MKISKSIIGTIAVLIYIASLFAAIRFEIEHPMDKFGGLFLVALTFPWSLLITFVLDLMDIIDSLSDTVKTSLLLLGAIPNVCFIYWIWALIGQSFRKKRA